MMLAKDTLKKAAIRTVVSRSASTAAAE